MLLARVNHEQAARQVLHLADAAQVLQKLLALGHQLDDFLLRQHFELAALFHRVDGVQARDTGLDGAEVGHHAAQPAVIDIIHVAALGLGLDGLLRLLLGADEQHALAFHRDGANESISLVDLADGLLQINDVDAVALGEDVRRHFGVPAAGLMAEVNAGLQKLLHRDNCHVCFPPFIKPSLRPLACADRVFAAGRTKTGAGAFSGQLYHVFSRESSLFFEKATQSRSPAPQFTLFRHA